MARPKGIPSTLKGKKYEEIHGKERAEEIKKKLFKVIKINCRDCGLEIDRKHPAQELCTECSSNLKKERSNKCSKLYFQITENKNKIREYQRSYREKNKEKLNEQSKEKYEKNKNLPEFKEKRRKYKKEYIINNREKINLKNREYNKRPEVKLKISKWNKKANEKRKSQRNVLVNCACGCGMIIKSPSIYAIGHATKNKPRNEIWRKNISLSNIGRKRTDYKNIKCYSCGIEVCSCSPNRKYCDNCYAIRKEKRKKEYPIEYRIKNKRHINNYLKNKRNTDINYAIAIRLRGALRRALLNYSKNGKIKSSKMYGIDYNKIIEYLLPFPEDISKYHIDHIKPLCSFNLNDDEQVKTAFIPENHRWLLKQDNLKKVGMDMKMSIRRNQDVEV